MTSYTHLAPEERCYINRRVREGDTLRDIAQALGRCPATISREVRRNRSGRGYRWKAAQRLADARQAGKPRCVRLTDGLKARIHELLQAGWTPEQIGGRLRPPLPQLGAGLERAQQRAAAPVLPEVNAVRPHHPQPGEPGR